MRKSLVETDMGNEIDWRIQASWKTFEEHKIVLQSNIPNSLKKLYNHCVLRAMIYASETGTLTKALERGLAITQRNMERAMVCESWQGHRTNNVVRSKTKVRDIMHTIKARNGLGLVT